MLYIFMAYFSALLIFLASGGWLFSETTIIKQYRVDVRDYSLSLTSPRVPYWYYSSDALMQSNNPFPSKFMGYSKVEYDQIYKDRFCDVVGIPETMIAEGFFKNRPLFFNIDINLLPNLSSWEWGGASDFPLQGPGYIVPSAQGYFNQAEQRFYVSDGRQYQVVPEPTSFSLLLAGLVLLISRRRLKERNNLSHA
jgi:hypothetical protein